VIKKKEKLSPKSTKANKKLENISLVDLVVKGMLEKKARAITIIDLRNIKSAVADYFIICSANTDTQIDAIRQSIEEEVYKASGQDVWMKEGIQNKEWILLDYADVVAHIFRTDRREFYGLEDLWGDADITVLDDDTAEPIKKPKKEPVKVAKKSTSKPTNITVSGKKAAPKKTVAKKTTTKKVAAKKPTTKKRTTK